MEGASDSTRRGDRTPDPDASFPGLRPSAFPDTALRALLHDAGIDPDRAAEARAASWNRHGAILHCHLPGTHVAYGRRGCYPALSLTGAACAQDCAHCGGALLRSMPDASDPGRLIELCEGVAARGGRGVLLTGGCDGMGRLPWNAFLKAIARIKARTGLHVSVHCGMVDRALALGLKDAGVDQALVDIIGSPETYREVYGLDDGGRHLETCLDALASAGLDIVPHVVAGLHFGQILGEERALRLVRTLRPKLLVLVCLMPLPGTRMARVSPPRPADVARLVLLARELLPDSRLSLGCARPRRTSEELERLALLCGVNSMALPCEETLELATALGMETRFAPTCCSLPCPEPDTDAEGAGDGLPPPFAAGQPFRTAL